MLCGEYRNQKRRDPLEADGGGHTTAVSRALRSGTRIVALANLSTSDPVRRNHLSVLPKRLVCTICIVPLAHR